ncbi:sulfate permease [Sulfurisoma sediminicola]|uniref:SulP family sulfate permease n=1 Tax=Sulfurisoma sediminicola TaxID=1381557 RepID=A0A497XIL6_9PROT|nr:sulfate permease [Sulfurisoma sediminicola]RLJ67684.1 SulP family sulfate permease [Sulfurisoma sediminicola]
MTAHTAPWLRKLFPFLLWWPLVNRRTAKDDLLAGITGALIVLPQGVAFATIAGLPPQYGLYAAMMPAVIGALFGSSWHLVSGPTTAISIAVFAALSHQADPGSAHYIQLVLTLTFLVGVFQLVLGLARMGALVNFISHTVVIGFTAGAAILIAASQVRNFFGINIPRGTPFYEIVHQLVVQAGDINPWVAGVGGVTLVTGILARRYIKKIPYMIAAMIVGSIVAEILNLWIGQDATGIKTVGALPAQLPPLSAPDFSLDTLRHTIGPALVITMLALTEAVSISRAIAVRSEQRIDGNQEFIGQGLSNIVGAFFSAYASSGSFNRSGVNYEAGARTPLASVFASIFLLLVLLAVAPLAAYLPNAAMAGILFLVAWGLIDFHHISHIWHTSKTESAILASTLIGTLFNLEAGIFLGVFLSLVTFLYKSSKPEIVPVVPAVEEGAYHFVRAQGLPECPQLRIVRINGSVYFGSASYVQAVLQQIDEENPQQKSVLIAAASLVRIDIAGGEILAQEARRRRRMGGGLYFYRLSRPNYDFLRQGGYTHDIGEGAFFPVMTDVTRALYWTLDPDVCRNCKVRIFKECNSGLLPDGFRRQRLLFATDGSEFSHAPQEIAIELARRFGVTLDIMTSVPSAEESEIARARLSVTTRAALVAGVDTEEIVRVGKHPEAEVVAAAATADTNILIIGRRPTKGDIKEKLLGDIAARIVGRAQCHVLIAGWQSQMWKKRILVASDCSPEGEHVAEVATQLAKVTGTPVTLVAWGRDAGKIREDLDLQVGRMKVDGVDCDALYVEGGPEHAVITALRETEADLVIIGNHHMLGGSVPGHIIAQLSCPVLVANFGGPAPGIASAVINQA